MHRPQRALQRVDPILIDTALALCLCLFPTFRFLLGWQQIGLLDIALIMPLAFRRRMPVASFTTICSLLLAQAILVTVPTYGDIALLFGLYAIAAYGPIWAVWTGLGVGIVGAVIATLRWQPENLSFESITFVFAILSSMAFASWLLGYLARTRRSYVASLEDRARQLERDSAMQAQIATAAERSRIAREMHDVVAHSLSVMVVQADGALYAASARPEVAMETLRTISETGRRSLTEMRKLLGLLRNDDQDAELAPMPLAQDLPALIEQLRSSGLHIAFNVVGDLAQLDAATGLTTYRIVQEALTNTLKHGGPGVEAGVLVTINPHAVEIHVEDDGRGASVNDDGHGHGILGMRERIAVHAGVVHAGPRPGGGFQVSATLPLVGRPT